MRVCIDPGHCGDNVGASAVGGGLLEKDLTLEVALKLKNSLLAWNEVDMAMTRTVEATVPFPDRVHSVELHQSDLVISLHANAFESPDACGMTPFYWPGGKVGKQLAEAAAAMAPPRLRSERTVPTPADPDGYPDAHAVIARFRQPVLLYEMGYLTNGRDLGELKREGTHMQIVGSVMGALGSVLDQHRRV